VGEHTHEGSYYTERTGSKGRNNPTTMDPADSASRQLSIQAEVLERHEEMLKHVSKEQTALLQAMTELKGMLISSPNTAPTQPAPSLEAAAACPLPPSPPPRQREYSLPAPKKFDGELGRSRGFLTQCSLVFRQQPCAFASDSTKIAYLVQLMTGRALQWAQAVLNTQPSVSYDVFLSKFRCVFDKGASSDAAGHRMFSLKQGRRSVADFSVEFWILAEESGWEEKALRGAFLNSLNENIKRELATKELPKALSALINMCINLDDHMREFGRRAGDGRRPAGGTGTSRDLPTLMWRSEEEEQHGDEEQPMQLGGAKLSSSRLGRKQRTGECFLCGKRGHFVDSCPDRVKESARQ
uniref:CCHC-type domain-containing protein n=1 Tax=Astatotilapia calliptera TaxID=8154 RepID=A0A3P8RGE7_ASTCA